jgi:two-component system, cell cycle sensor histidine kinase and response regulator CckA
MPDEVPIASRPVNILLVDDEPQVRHLLCRLLLKDQNYSVLMAATGEEALELSRQRSEEIHLLITDIDMCAMNGIDLYRHIRNERPKIAVLFISGKADAFRDALVDCPLLEKPFALQSFVAKVKESLLVHKYGKQ